MPPVPLLDRRNLPPASLTPPAAVFGIDPSTVRMSLAVLMPVAARRWDVPAPFVVDTLSLPRGEGAARLAAAQRALVPWLGEMIAAWKPGLVVVEQPAGKNVPPVSYYTLGVLFSVLGAYRQRVVTMMPSEWKAKALGAGQGSVRKPRSPAEEYGVLTWARSAGYQGASWDEADAIGIATAGGVMLEQQSSSAAA